MYRTAASFAFPGTTCILFPILRLLTGSELMWNNALVIWDGAAAALLLLLLQGGNFFLRLSRRLFPCGGRATPVVPPFIRARERLHEGGSSLCPTIWTACLTVCGPDMRSGNGRSILNHILGERETTAVRRWQRRPESFRSHRGTSASYIINWREEEGREEVCLPKVGNRSVWTTVAPPSLPLLFL